MRLCNWGLYHSANTQGGCEGSQAFLNADCLTLQSEYPLSGAFYVIINPCRSELSTRMHRPPRGFTQRGALGTLTAVGLSLSRFVPADCNMPVVSTPFRLPQCQVITGWIKNSTAAFLENFLVFAGLRPIETLQAHRISLGGAALRVFWENFLLV